MHRSITAAALTVAAALAAPAVATADSIVYVDGGNVFSASPDGAKKVQLTDDGGWHSPTQADDGTIAAVQGAGEIEIMAGDGRPIRSITTTPARTGNGGWFRGTPVNLSFSPDGTKIAYEYTDIACPPASTCDQQHSVFYTASDVTRATPQEVYGNQFGAGDPEWISNARTVTTLGSTLAFDDLGGGDYSMTRWFSGSADFADAEFTRDGRRVAFNVGYGAATQIGFAVVDGDPAATVPARPAGFVCAADADPKLGDVSWSADGSAAAYESSAGIETVRFGRFATGDCDVVGSGVLSATGSSPDWGPANPPAARYTAAPTGVGAAPGGGTIGGGGVTTGGTTPGSTPTAGGSGAGANAGAGASTPSPGDSGAGANAGAGAVDAPGLRFTTAAVTRAALRRGLAVRVVAPAAGTVTATLTLRGKRLTSGKVRARRAGGITLRLGRLGAGRAAALRGKRVRLTVTAGGRTTTRTLRIR